MEMVPTQIHQQQPTDPLNGDHRSDVLYYPNSVPQWLCG